MSKNNSNMRLFCGSSHQTLGKAIAKSLDIELGKVLLSKFSCGEVYAKIEETIRGRDIYILQTISEKANDDYMELFLMMDALKRSSAAKIHVIIPHFGYARQDKKSAPREPISSRLIADLLDAVGFDRLITLDLHSDQIQGFFSVPVDHLTAMYLFVDYFSQKKIPNLVVAAPDAGRAKQAKKLADDLHADFAVMHKSRPKHNVAEVSNVIGDIKGKNVLLYDDMIDTAGSITSGVSVLKDLGALDIYIAATHAVFSGPAIQRLSTAGFKEVVVTDTIALPKEKQFPGLTVISTAEMLAEAIRHNDQKESISKLYHSGKAEEVQTY
ncbi:MAG: ribose-phosphate pyrophosphokinase [bacterium]